MVKICLVLGLLLTAGCTLYKSEDRDSFNRDALAGAPKTLLPAPLAIVRDTGADACWISPDKQNSITEDQPRQSVTVQAGTLVCLFSSSTYREESRAQVERNSTRLNEF